MEEWIQLCGENSILEVVGNSLLAVVVELTRFFSIYERAMNANPSD